MARQHTFSFPRMSEATRVVSRSDPLGSTVPSYETDNVVITGIPDNNTVRWGYPRLTDFVRERYLVQRRHTYIAFDRLYRDIRGRGFEIYDQPIYEPVTEADIREAARLINERQDSDNELNTELMRAQYDAIRYGTGYVNIAGTPAREQEQPIQGNKENQTMVKPHHSYSIHDIERLNFSLLKIKRDLTTTEGKASYDAEIEMFMFIKSASGHHGVDISHWSLIDKFCENSAKPLVIKKDRGAIIEQLAEYKAEIAKTYDTDLDADLKTHEAILNTVGSSAIDSDIKGIENDITYQMNQYNERMERAQEALSNARNNSARLDALMIAKTNFDSSVISNSIRDTGQLAYWTYLGFHEGKVYWVSTDDICVTAPLNETEDSEIATVNFGKILVCLELESNRLKAYPATNNISQFSLMPHISTPSICWGNVQGTVDDMMLKHDYVGVLAMFYQLISSYCPENPYTRFESYHKEANLGQNRRRDEGDEYKNLIAAIELAKLGRDGQREYYKINNMWFKKEHINDLEVLRCSGGFWCFMRDDRIYKAIRDWDNAYRLGEISSIAGRSYRFPTESHMNNSTDRPCIDYLQKEIDKINQGEE